MGEPKIVEGVGVASSRAGTDGPGGALAARVEASMAQAVTDAVKAGVSLADSPKIRAAMLEARQRVLDEAHEAQNTASRKITAAMNQPTKRSE